MFKEFFALFRKGDQLHQAFDRSHEMLRDDQEMFDAAIKSLRERDDARLDVDIYAMDQRINAYQRELTMQLLPRAPKKRGDVEGLITEQRQQGVGTGLAEVLTQKGYLSPDGAQALQREMARANLEKSRRDAQRHADLYEDKVTSEYSREQADLKARIDEGQLKVTRARLAVAERDLADASIVSPVGGEITRRHVEVGELVEAGTPLLTK